MKIRKAKIEDLETITEIYNYSIINSVATFDTVPKTMDYQKEWFYHHTDKYPLLVAEDTGGIVGWVSLSQWSDRCAYDKTAEISVYVNKNNQGRGIGNKLIVNIINCAKKKNLHTIIARIDGENEISVHLHKKNGFNYIGSLKEVGFKFNKYIDVHLMQLIL